MLSLGRVISGGLNWPARVLDGRFYYLASKEGHLWIYRVLDGVDHALNHL